MPPTEPDPTPAPRPRRRWWSLSVRGLMLLVLVVGGLVGWEMNRVTRVRRAVAALERNPDDPPGERPTSDAVGFSDVVSFDIGDKPARTSVLFGRVESRWVPDWLRAVVGDEHFPRVAVLKLSRPPTPADWDAIAALGPVYSLEANYVTLGANDLDRLPVCADLRTLHLFNTRATDRALAGAGTLRHLRNLDVRMTAISPAGLAPLANLTDLEELQLSARAGTDAGIHHLRGLTNLRVLEAKGFSNALTDAGIADLRGMTQLEELEFAARRVTDAGIAVLAGLPRLRVLQIQPAWPDVAEAITLSPRGVELLGQMTHLESLELTPQTAIDDTWLRAIGRLTGLKHLNIAGDGITDAGLIHLAGLTQLEELRIASPHVSDAGLDHLRPLTRLTALSFYAEVSDAGIAAIRPAWPALKRVHNSRRSDDAVPAPPAPLKIAVPPGFLRPAPAAPPRIAVPPAP